VVGVAVTGATLINNGDRMKRFEIWSEGYAATGQSSGAIQIGIAGGHTFQEACKNWARVYCTSPECYNPDRNAYWGCKLFDNEAEARRRFG